MARPSLLILVLSRRQQYGRELTKGSDDSVKHLLITREDGTCGCPCHLLGSIVLHPIECCRRCPSCGKNLPVGVDGHTCAPRKPLSRSSDQP